MIQEEEGGGIRGGGIYFVCMIARRWWRLGGRYVECEEEMSRCKGRGRCGWSRGVIYFMVQAHDCALTKGRCSGE